MKCTYLMPNGASCGANAIKESDLCINHNPEYVEVKSMAVVKGGMNRREIPTSYGDELVLENPNDIKKLVADTLNLIWTGRMPTNNISGSIGFLCRIFLDAYDKAVLEERIEEIEMKLETVKK